LWLIKLFELEVSARKICEQIDLSYPTVLKALTVIRMAIVANSPDLQLLAGEIELDEFYFCGKRKGKRGRGAFNKVPVFGILERDGIVKVEVVNDVSAETLLNLNIKTVRRGSIVYTDKFRSYDALMCCGYRHLKVDHGKRFSTGKVYINGLKHHGVSKEKFPIYLKEMEFRYNNRNTQIFHELAKYLANLVPDLL
jgi:transposase